MTRPPLVGNTTGMVCIPSPARFVIKGSSNEVGGIIVTRTFIFSLLLACPPVPADVVVPNKRPVWFLGPGWWPEAPLDRGWRLGIVYSRPSVTASYRGKQGEAYLHTVTDCVCNRWTREHIPPSPRIQPTSNVRRRPLQSPGQRYVWYNPLVTLVTPYTVLSCHPQLVVPEITAKVALRASEPTRKCHHDIHTTIMYHEGTYTLLLRQRVPRGRQYLARNNRDALTFRFQYGFPCAPELIRQPTILTVCSQFAVRPVLRWKSHQLVPMNYVARLVVHWCGVFKMFKFARFRSSLAWCGRV